LEGLLVRVITAFGLTHKSWVSCDSRRR